MYWRNFAAAMIAFALLTAAHEAGAAQKILTRSEWGATDPKDILKKLKKEKKWPLPVVITGPKRKTPENDILDRYKAAYITIHHATGPRRAQTPLKVKLLGFQTFMRKGYPIQYPKYVRLVTFLDIPYHYYVSMNGEVAEGRDLKYSAASNTIYETDIREHITVVLEGNFEDVEPTEEQMKALVELLASVAKRHKIPLKNVSYHRAVTKQYTACPGKNLINKMDMIQAALRKKGIKE